MIGQEVALEAGAAVELPAAGQVPSGAVLSRDVGLATILRHAFCVAILMWTGLVNGQPFFFPDTTNYVRAADAAVYLASGRTMSTAWTDRYRAVLPASQPASNIGAPASKPPTTANDVASGTIMGGRSPYFGALLYAGYLLGDFWPFVLLQAVVAYLLIGLSLRQFRLNTPRNLLLTTIALAVTTSLPTYNSLLLADALASFGMIAFVLLACARTLSRAERVFLTLVLLTSVVSHLTHIMMLIGMVATLALLRAVRWIAPVPRIAWIAGVAGILIGLGSVQLTSIATRAAFGRAPQLLPLITARFYIDGPGKAFIDSGCDGGRFEVCHIPMGSPPNNTLWLFSTEPATGAYLLATPAQRRLMGAQDVPFALAVLRHDPVGQIGMMMWNTVKQLLWIEYSGMNQGCFDRPGCWNSLPPDVRETLRNSPSGHNAWPQHAMNILLHAAVIASLLVLAWTARTIARGEPETWRTMRTWLIVGGAGMLVCCFFGGAISDPQYRYQGRLIWMVVLMGAIAFLLYRRARAHAAGPLNS